MSCGYRSRAWVAWLGVCAWTLVAGCGSDGADSSAAGSGGATAGSGGSGGTSGGSGSGGTSTNGGSGGTSGTGGSSGEGGSGGVAGASGTGGTAGTGGGTGGAAGAGGGTRKTTSMGMGLNGISDWSTQFPLLDLMKWSRGWQDWSNGGADVTSIDQDGWVQSLAAGESAGTVFLTNPDAGPIPYTRFVVRWQGQGTLSYQWGAHKVGTASGGDLIEVGGGSCLLRIDTTDPNDYIRDITIVPEEHVAAFDAGGVFNPDWIARVQDFRAVRFMDWMQTNGSEQQSWADRPKPTDRTWTRAGVPVEIMVALANELNADPWFNMPHQADDDYVREFATVVRDSLAPHLIAYVEHSNEVWNWGFAQSQYALAQGKARWGDHGDAHMQWHGMRTAQICDIWKQEVFTAGAQRVNCVLGTQAGWQGLEDPALNCPLWQAEGNTACYEHGIDYIGITGYFNGCLHGSSQTEIDLIRSWFNDADGGLTKGMEQLEDARHFSCDWSVDGMASSYAYFKQVADQYGLEMVAYEGGQHITGNGHPTQDDQDFIDFHIALNRDARMKQRYLDNFTSWQNEGGALFVHFVDISAPSKWGSWGALESVAQDTSPKWEAIVDFNQNTCWWPGC